VLTGKGRPTRDGRADQPQLLAQPLDDVPNLLEEYVARFLNLRLFLEQAGLRIKPTRFLMFSGAIGLAAGVAWVLVGVFVFAAPLVAISFAVLPLLVVAWLRKRRLTSFGKLLPEALELIARALRSGHSLAAGMKLVADEIGDPLRTEFQRVYEEQNFGIPLEDALQEMADRVPNLDLRFFVTAVILQRQTGGDLAEILDKIGALVRERFQIYGLVQALTGEGRLSGTVLLALPPVLGIVVYRLNPGYIMMLFDDPLGQKMLAAAVVMQILGAFVIRKIVNIKV
jgi:tight adherence protein B